jgi:hypothetical protein
MLNSSLSPEEDALLRFAVVQSALHWAGVHKRELDRRIQGDSADSSHKLVEHGFLSRTGTGEFSPTIHGLLYLPEYSVFVRQVLDGVVIFGSQLLNSDKIDTSVNADRLAQEVESKTMLGLDQPGYRFLFDCSLDGLNPYISVQGRSLQGRPQTLFFAASLLGITTGDALLAKVRADAGAAAERAARAKSPRQRRKRKRVPPQQIIITGPVGTVQAGEKSTANVTQNVAWVEGGKPVASEIAALIEEAARNAGNEAAAFQRFEPALARLEKKLNETNLDVQFIAELVGGEFVTKQMPIAKYGPAATKLVEIVPGGVGKILAAFVSLFIKS